MNLRLEVDSRALLVENILKIIEKRLFSTSDSAVLMSHNGFVEIAPFVQCPTQTSKAVVTTLQPQALLPLGSLTIALSVQYIRLVIGLDLNALRNSIDYVDNSAE